MKQLPYKHDCRITELVHGIDIINVCNVYKKLLINAFVNSVNVYYLNKRYMNAEKALLNS